MSAIDVLAQALYEQVKTRQRDPVAWDSLPIGVQDGWRGQAEVVAARMLEAERSTTRPEPADLGAGIEALTAAADALGTYPIKGHDPETLVRLLDRLRAAIDTARTVDSLIVTELYLRHEHGKTVYDGIGQVEVSRTRDRRAWDIRGVCQAVLDARMAERGGEMPNDPWEVAEWLLEVLPGGDPRLTPLRALRLDPDDFHTNTPGNPVVRLPPRS